MLLLLLLKHRSATKWLMGHEQDATASLQDTTANKLTTPTLWPG